MLHHLGITCSLFVEDKQAQVSLLLFTSFLTKSAVAPLISLYILVPTILGLVFRNEKKTPVKIIGILLALTSIGMKMIFYDLQIVLFALGSGGSWSLLTITNFLYYLLGFFGYINLLKCWE